MSFERETISVIVSSSSVNQPASNFTTNLSKPIKLNEGRWVCALTNLAIWTTNYNITASAGNNVIRYFDPYASSGAGAWNIFTLKDGVYTVQNIIDLFNDHLIENEPAISPEPDVYPYLSLSIIPEQITTQWNFALPASPATQNFQVDMTYGTMYKILGFNPAIYNTTTTGQNQADITNGVSSYNIHCNFLDAGSTLVAGQPSDVIFSYSPNEPPGSLISYVPTFPIFLNCSSSVLQSITLTVRDNNGNIIDLNSGPTNQNNPTTCQLLFVRKDDATQEQSRFR